MDLTTKSYKKLKRCIDCQHCIVHLENDIYYYDCTYRAKYETNLVTGKVTYGGRYYDCYKARKKKRLCGKEGKWFEPNLELPILTYPPDVE